MTDAVLDQMCARIGSDLRKLRRARGFSQSEAALGVGVSRQTLHRIESGDMGVAIGTVVALARLYDAPESFLTVLGAPTRPRLPEREPIMSL